VRKSLVAFAAMAALMIGATDGAQAKEYRVYTCSIVDEQVPLGPTVLGSRITSGWEVGSSGLTGVAVNDRCPVGYPFTAQIVGATMSAGESAWVHWMAPADTHLVRFAVV
jgi:glycerol uptake facilitator-like aquaporin